MAKYDYKCTKCNLIKEITHKMMESPKILCEKCGEIMKRLISQGSTHTTKSLAKKLLPKQYAEIYDKYKDKGKK